MNVNIFSKYEVKYKCDYAYRYGDGFQEDVVEWDKIMNSNELIDLVYNLCKLELFYDLYVKDNKIIVSLFNAMTGESADYKIEYKEVVEKR